MSEQNQSRPLYKRWWIWAVGLPAFILLINLLAHSGGSNSSNSNSGPAITQTSEIAVGTDGYLRLPGTADSKQVICLGTTKGDADAVGKALLAKDSAGLLELATASKAFCVGNGSKAKLLENDYPYRRVRITAGVNPVDSDKVLRSGYLPQEWFVQN